MITTNFICGGNRTNKPRSFTHLEVKYFLRKNYKPYNFFTIKIRQLYQRIGAELIPS